MKRVIFLIVMILMGILISLFLISLTFDFDNLEGRGADKKTKVNWAFQNAIHFDSVENYLLLQRFDSVREKPRLSVQGRYWLKGNRYLEINDISADVFTGEKCLGFKIENYTLKCSIDSKEPILVCQSSFLSKENIIPPEPSVFDVINSYDEIKTFYQKYPQESSKGIKYRGSNIPQPLQKHFTVSSETQINCWVEQSKISFSKPDMFLCDERFHKCGASSSISLKYAK